MIAAIRRPFGVARSNVRPFIAITDTRQEYAWNWKSHLENYRALRDEANTLPTAIGPEQPGLRRVLSAMARLQLVASVPPEALAV